MKIKDYPVIKTLILFLSGFFIAYHIKIPLNFLFLLIILLIILTFIFVRIKSILKVFTISILVIATGALVFSSSYYENDKEIHLLDKLNGQKILIYGEVRKVDYLDKDKIQFVLNGDKLIVNNKWIKINQKILVNLNLSNTTFSLNYFNKIISPGNSIRISGNLLKPDESKFVGDFNSRLFLKSKEINYTLNSNIFDELNLLRANKSIFNFSRFLNDLRLKIKFQIEENYTPIIAAYIKGLFIAERSDIPEEIKNDFINSGVIHVLAVSGLHTGYIALILFAFTSRFNKWIKLILVMIGLFVFVHLANLSPSVIRASVMSVLVLFSMIMERQNYILNSIAFACLLILMINPLDLFNPGFQLSFSAVLSIAIIYPVLTNLVNVKRFSGLSKYIIDLILISFAVSLGTFPFVVTYYQKFSFISLLANLIVIPLTGLILGGIILNLVVINVFPQFVSIYKIALTELINLNFTVVKFFANLPFAYSSIKNFSIQNAVFYYALIGLIIWIMNKNYRPFMKFVFVTLLIFNYVFHFRELSDNKILIDEPHLILMKMNNSNSIFFGNDENSFLRFYEKTDFLKSIQNDMNKVNSIFEQLNLKNIHTANINSNAIWLKNDLKTKLNNLNIYRINENNWFFSDSKVIDEDYLHVDKKNIEYRFFEKSLTDVFTFNDWHLIISPIDFNKIKNLELKQNLKFIFIKPELDTLFIKSSKHIFQKIPINFEGTMMKVFKIEKENLKEIEWR